jgi:hypothetical protein
MQRFRYRRFVGRLHCRLPRGRPHGDPSEGEPTIGSADWPSGGTAVLHTTRQGGRPGTFGSSSRRSDIPTLETAAEVPGNGDTGLVFGPADVRKRRNLRVHLPTDGEAPRGWRFVEAPSGPSRVPRARVELSGDSRQCRLFRDSRLAVWGGGDERYVRRASPWEGPERRRIVRMVGHGPVGEPVDIGRNWFGSHSVVPRG